MDTKSVKQHVQGHCLNPNNYSVLIHFNVAVLVLFVCVVGYITIIVYML